MTPQKEGRVAKVNYADYDKALYYTHRSQWDNLLILMVRTEDDLLSKRIEHFLHAYNFERDDAIVEKGFMICCNTLITPHFRDKNTKTTCSFLRKIK